MKAMKESPLREKLAQVLARNYWFRRRPAELRKKLIAGMQVSTVEAGHALYDLGDEAHGLYGVLTGSVTTYVALDNGEEAPVNISGPSSIFGYAAQILGGHRVTTAVTRERSEIIFIPQHALATIAHDVPEIWLHFAELATEQLTWAMKNLAEHSCLTPKARLASRLHAYSAVWENKDGIITLPIRQEELAELTGLSRKSVNQFLRDFERNEFISQGYRAIHIHNVGGLQKIAMGASI